jgi:hypothetical protein
MALTILVQSPGYSGLFDYVDSTEPRSPTGPAAGVHPGGTR